jgi:hypothetical protein
VSDNLSRQGKLTRQIHSKLLISTVTKNVDP